MRGRDPQPGDPARRERADYGLHVGMAGARLRPCPLALSLPYASYHLRLGCTLRDVLHASLMVHAKCDGHISMAKCSRMRTLHARF